MSHHFGPHCRKLLFWVILPLLLGAVSYLFWRPPTEAEFVFRDLMGWAEPQRRYAPCSFGWVSDVWADACWAFALYAALRIMARIRLPWLALVAALGFEAAQHLQHVSGTFDYKDQLAIVAAILLAYFLMSHWEEGRSYDDNE